MSETRKEETVDRVARWLVRWRILCLAIAAAVYLAAWGPAQRLPMDWSIDSMFPAGDPLVASYHRLKDRFGGNEIALAVYRDPELWDESGRGLDRVKAISDRLSSVQGVRAVLSLAELQRILETLQVPMGLLQSSILPTPGNAKPPLVDAEHKLAQALADVFEGYTHLRGSPYVALACLLEPTRGDRRSHQATIGELRYRLAYLPAPASEGLLAGEPVMVNDGFEILEQDGWRLGTASMGLLATVLIICFRSVRWTLIPLIIVAWTVTVTQAILSLAGLELTLVSSMLVSIVTVIGVATVMHFMLKYSQLRRQAVERSAAIENTLATLLIPIGWACVTDAVGFVALTAADVGPVRDFGVMMAIGSLVVMVAIPLLVPGLGLIGRWDIDLRAPPYDFLIRVSLRALLTRVLESRRMGIVILIALAIFGVWGSLLIRVETDFTKNFRADSELNRGYRNIERELGGAGVWDVMLPAPDILSHEYLELVRELESQLREIRIDAGGFHAMASTAQSADSALAETSNGFLRLTKVLSVADAVHASESEPMLAALPMSARLEGMRRAMPDFFQALLTDDKSVDGYRWLRIMLRSREQAPADGKRALIQAVTRYVEDFTKQPRWRQQFPPGEIPAAEVTGYHVMLGRLISNVLADQWKCFCFATLGILVTMAIATGSLWMALAALVPNALSIFIVLGAMGWLGIRVNMGAAMIAAVSMGLSIDNSIHYILHILSARRAGVKTPKAFRSAQENVGQALIMATAALIAGFLSLCGSQFIPTIVFGSLVALTMLGGLVGNLVVLPLLIAPRSMR